MLRWLRFNCRILVPAVFMTASVQVAAQHAFVHPGLLNNLAELHFMKSQIRANQEPWKNAYSMIPSFLDHVPHPVAEYKDGAGHSDPEDVNMRKLRMDGMAAYGSALHWIVTGDTAHARKVVEILNAWSNTLQSISTWEDGPLSTSYCWPNMIFAAEILRHTYSGWSRFNQDQFKRLLLDIVWPATQRAEDKPNFNNWRSFAIFCRTAIAIYVDDSTRFQNAMDKLRHQIVTYCYPSGQCIETARDLWHTQMGLAPLAAACEMAWHQGVDVYSVGNNRLLGSIEWHVPFIMKETAGWPTSFDSPYYPADRPKEAADPWPFYELVYNHYHNRQGISTPNTWKILTQPVPGESKFPVRPEATSRTGGWGTVTHVRHDLLISVKVDPELF